MQDSKTTIKELKDLVETFVQEREWKQFHSPKNLSMGISIEANELMEKFVWVDGKESYEVIKTKRQEVEDELADVIIASFIFAQHNNIDISKIFHHKLEEIKKKYPIELSKGKNLKYTEI